MHPYHPKVKAVSRRCFVVQKSIMESLRVRSPTAILPLAQCSSLRPQGFKSCRFTQPKAFKLTRQPQRRISQHCQGIQANAVKTHDDFHFNHSLSENLFEVKGDIDKIFQYAGDFSHIDKWDSGTTDSKLRESDSRAAFKVGDTVSLMTVLLGVKSSTLYQLLEMERPNKVVFFGISRFHESTDTVTFSKKAGSEDIVQVKYTTDIQLVRWYRYFQPFLGFLMANLAKDAVEGMQEKLKEMQQQGKFAAEKATASR